MAKGKLAVGLDIGSSSVKVILLKEHRRRGHLGYALQSFGMKPLPPEAIVDGALMNSTAIVQAIQELMAELRVKQREVAIGVSGHSVIIKKIAMPRMSQEELEESIQWEAEQYIPFDVKDVNIDTQILAQEANDATGQMDVLLVAAKKDMINDYTTVVSEAGLSPVVVDVDAFAVQNMFDVNYEAPTSDTVVLINAGASVININIVSRGVTTFTRDVTIGGNQFTEEIQKQLNVSYEAGGGAGDFRGGGAGGGGDPALARLLRGHRRRRALQQGLPLRRHRQDPRPVQDDRDSGGSAGGDPQPLQVGRDRQPQVRSGLHHGRGPDGGGGSGSGAAAPRRQAELARHEDAPR
jgi:type IV pilus assembly protein PilM